MRTHVDLFSGIGGFSLACEWAGVETIAFSEIDHYASRVLQRHWPNVRNYGDVRGFPSLSAWLLTAGVPCQPASVAGKRKGAEDDRWLWPQTLTVVENGSYEWLLFENPTGIVSLNDGLEFERICSALESKGYEVQPLVIPSAGLGSLHRRERVWILAHANKIGRETEGVSVRPGRQGKTAPELLRTYEDAEFSANDWPQRIQGTWKKAASWLAAFQRGEDERRLEQLRVRLDLPQPLIRRNGNGLPNAMDRIMCLGNAIVPQVAYELIKRMIEAEENETKPFKTF